MVNRSSSRKKTSPPTETNAPSSRPAAVPAKKSRSAAPPPPALPSRLPSRPGRGTNAKREVNKSSPPAKRRAPGEAAAEKLAKKRAAEARADREEKALLELAAMEVDEDEEQKAHRALVPRRLSDILAAAGESSDIEMDSGTTFDASLETDVSSNSEGAGDDEYEDRSLTVSEMQARARKA